MKYLGVSAVVVVMTVLSGMVLTTPFVSAQVEVPPVPQIVRPIWMQRLAP